MGEAKTKPAKGKRTGRPATEFTREQVDEALRLLGEEYYSSRVCTRLVEKFPGLSRDVGYRLIDQAREEITAHITSEHGQSPVVTIYTGLLALAFGEGVKPAVKVQAFNGMTKLLGVRALQKLGEAGDIDVFLAQVQARAAARIVPTEASKP